MGAAVFIPVPLYHLPIHCDVVNAQGELSFRQAQSCWGDGKDLGTQGKGVLQDLRESIETRRRNAGKYLILEEMQRSFPTSEKTSN